MLDLEAGVSIAVMSLSYWFSHACVHVVYKIPYRRARVWPSGCAREQRYLAYKCSRDSEPYMIVFSTFKSCDQTPN